MLKLVWFISPPERDIENFEDWYQSEHVTNGMRQENLQRFRISRSFLPQPDFVKEKTGSATPRSYRFSEGYWNNLPEMQQCYVSPNGRAALADGALNIPPAKNPPKPQPVLIVEEQPFPTNDELGFNVRTGKYRAELACKLFGFVRLKKGTAAKFDKRYEALAGKVGSNADIRGHVLGRTQQDAVVRPGRVMQWPPAGAETFDRTLEYYFDSRAGMDRFCKSGVMGEITALVDEFAEASTWDATQIQEVFYTSRGDQPLEESWKALYRK